LLPAGLAAACGSAQDPTKPPADAGPEPPPRICKTPAPPAGPWFAEVTGEVGLAKTDTFEPLAISVIAADLDGDGFVDLLAQHYLSARGLIGGKRARFVLMNRPAGGDPAARIFVDETEGSGLLATRDGAGDRGYGL